MSAQRSWIRPVASLVFLACLGVAVGGWVLRRSFHEPVPVRVASPAYGVVSELVTTNGDVEPVTQFQARANFPGIVEKVLVHLGDKVSAGQLLVTMRDPYAASRVASARAVVSGAEEADQNFKQGGSSEDRINYKGDLEHAQLAVDDAKNGLTLLEQLQKQGAAGAGEVGGARRRLKDATINLATIQQRATKRFSPAAIEASQARLADANAALSAAKVTYDNANIRSPIAGTVYVVSISPYDFAPMGAELMRVTDLNQEQIRAFFDEPEVGKLHEGQAVTITWDGRPGVIWHGHIGRAPVAAVQRGDRSVAECVIGIDDGHGELLPNTHVIVTVAIAQHMHVLTVPRRALQVDTDGDSVFRVIDGKLVRTPVTVGLLNLDVVEVRSGLSPQDVVAVQALNEQPLTSGMPVVAVP